MMTAQDKIKSLDDAIALRETWRHQNNKVVFTNGCFDILHIGHVLYLEQARQLGDKLILGLNTDQSIGKIKGPDRPIMDEHARAVVLAGLGSVDAVVLFDDETPFKLIRSLNPDVLVKGGDYLAENIVGADIVKKNGGRVITIPLVAGYSTTAIINRIKK